MKAQYHKGTDGSRKFCSWSTDNAHIKEQTQQDDDTMQSTTHIMNVFTVIFDQFNAFLLNKTINVSSIKNTWNT